MPTEGLMNVDCDEQRQPLLPYTFKSSRWSSHSVILRALPERGEGRQVLDLGSGPGYIATRLAARGFRVTAVDCVAPEQIPPGVEFLAADLNDLQRLAMENRFHYVLLADVLEHMLQPAGLLAWAAARLEPEGRLVISIPNVAHLYVRLKLLAGDFDYDERGILDRTHLHFYTRKSFEALLGSCGLCCLEFWATPVPVELLVPEKMQGALFQGLQGLHAAVARLFPRLLGYQFVCLAARQGSR